MTYEMMNSTAMGSDLAYVFIYANLVTHGWAVLLFVICFFLIVLISSIVMQQRFTGRIRPEISFLASLFATLGLAVLLEQRTGLLGQEYFFILIGLVILAIIWVAFSE